VGTGERAENFVKPYQALKLYRKRSCIDQKGVPKKSCTEEMLYRRKGALF
jgi:hypothetical protein